MQERLANACAASSERLEQAPHVLTQLLDLFENTFQPSPEQQQHIIQHLATCMHCQLVIEIVLQGLLEDAREHEEATEQAQSLLAYWLNLTHATLKEQIPAYVDLVLAQGEQSAGADFPLLAEHLQRCQKCRAEVRTLCEWFA